MIESKTRREIIAIAKKQIAEIDQFFADAEHYNSTRTVFEHVNPDPDGLIMEFRSALEKTVSA